MEESNDNSEAQVTKDAILRMQAKHAQEQRQIDHIGLLVKQEATYVNSFEVMQLTDSMIRIVFAEGTIPQLPPHVRCAIAIPCEQGRKLGELLVEFFEKMDLANAPAGEKQ